MNAAGKLAQVLVRKLLLEPTLPLSQGLLDQANETAAALSLSVERVLKVRPGTWKAILLCQHPRHGRCVLKFVSAQSPSNGQHAHVGSAALVARSRHPLFPEVYAIGDNYTVEEFIPGRSLADFAPVDFGEIHLQTLLESVRSFGDCGHSGVTLSAEEYRLILYRNLDKLPISYYSSGSWFNISRLVARSARVERMMRRALSEFDRVRLPRGYAVGDLGIQNVVLADADSSFRLIDAEHVTYGFWGLDQAWFLLTLTRLPLEGPMLEAAFDTIVGSKALQDLEAVEWMRAVSVLLLEMNSILADPGCARRSRKLLRYITSGG
jgi:hypothetical protein